jgi:hypothetical protein
MRNPQPAPAPIPLRRWLTRLVPVVAAGDVWTNWPGCIPDAYSVRAHVLAPGRPPLQLHAQLVRLPGGEEVAIDGLLQHPALQGCSVRSVRLRADDVLEVVVAEGPACCTCGGAQPQTAPSPHGRGLPQQPRAQQQAPQPAVLEQQLGAGAAPAAPHTPSAPPALQAPAAPGTSSSGSSSSGGVLPAAADEERLMLAAQVAHLVALLARSSAPGAALPAARLGGQAGLWAPEALSAVLEAGVALGLLQLAGPAAPDGGGSSPAVSLGAGLLEALQAGASEGASLQVRQAAHFALAASLGGAQQQQQQQQQQPAGERVARLLGYAGWWCALEEGWQEEGEEGEREEGDGQREAQQHREALQRESLAAHLRRLARGVGGAAGAGRGGGGAGRAGRVAAGVGGGAVIGAGCVGCCAAELQLSE